ncbi:Protein NDUFAF4 -like protein [Halotydeus destructor]|nr:Protein NDUFAF4 -like protein [Halotydeus destructor]
MSVVKKALDSVKRIYRYAVVRPLQRYNTENRAFKVIERSETIPKAAPHLQVTEDFITQVAQEHPEIQNEINSNPSGLLDNLKRVHIKSGDVKQPLPADVTNEEAKKPKKRIAEPLPLFGIAEPTQVSPGRVSLGSAMKIVEIKHKKQEEWDAKKIADRFTVDVRHVEMITQNFRPFQVFTNKGEEELSWYSAKRMEYLLENIGAGPDPSERKKLSEMKKEYKVESLLEEDIQEKAKSKTEKSSKL